MPLTRLLDQVCAGGIDAATAWAVGHVAGMLDAGTAADRQLMMERRGASLEDIVAAVATETAATVG